MGLIPILGLIRLSYWALIILMRSTNMSTQHIHNLKDLYTELSNGAVVNVPTSSDTRSDIRIKEHGEIECFCEETQSHGQYDSFLEFLRYECTEDLRLNKITDIEEHILGDSLFVVDELTVEERVYL
jgi:hypothetical protein